MVSCPPAEVLALAEALVAQVEPAEFERLRVELMDSRRLRDQAARRAQAERARRAEAGRVAREREALRAEWNTSVWFSSRRAMPPRMKAVSSGGSASRTTSGYPE